jgi:glycosyltransferase involved in cell wall biosynthesis
MSAPRVSVFTPSHNPRWLAEAYESLRAQTFTDWEWIVLLNSKTPSWKPVEDDPRVLVRRAPPTAHGIGGLKRAACELTSGEILVELDHDDRLSSNCLAELVEAFRDPSIVFAYSDFAQINDDGTPNHDRFDAGYGWVYTPGEVDGVVYDRCHVLEPSPHNLGYIWYAPNHVRAFRRDTYLEVGGYTDGLAFLDDQELISRMYLAGEFRQLTRCLYFQRVHGKNTQSQRGINEAIQEQTVVYYREFIEQMALAWAKRRGLRCLRLRTPIAIGHEPDERYEDLVVDPHNPRIAADDDTVALIKAVDVLQRIPNRAQIFNEAYRALTHAGLIITHTPSTDGRGAFQDPSHTTFYNENSFMYLTQAGLREAIPDLTARLQVSHLRTFYPTQTHVDMQIPYVEANLLAIKDGPRQGGPLLA